MVGETVKELLLSKGSKVEVSSDEEGFKGAWFVATVVEPFPKSKQSSRKKPQHQHHDSILVEYQNLVADEDRSTPLREYVHPSFIRPLPPSYEAEDVSFELNDVVDAFYRDGWWSGVITAVVENSRFRVFFQNPPEEVEFGLSELRVHQEWVDGKWVRSEKQRMAGFKFCKGAPVEVNLGIENSRDVWVPATVCEEIDNNFLVDYHSSRNGDEVSILKATVDPLHIRPLPPNLGDKNFELLEKVDAFFDLGWWSGIITKVLAGRRYTVYFKHINKDMDLSHSELRAHMEWTNGKWLNGSEEVIITSTHEEQVEQARNSSNNIEMDVQLETSGAAKSSAEEKTTSSTNTRKNLREKLSPRNEKSPYVATLSKKKTRHTYHSSDAMLSQPSKKLKEENAMEALRSPTACQSRLMPIETSTKETVFDSSTLTMGGTETNGTGQAVTGDQPSAKTKSRVSRNKVEIEQNRVSALVNQEKDLVKGKGGRPRKSLLKSPQVSTQDGNAGEVEVPGVTGVESEEMKSSQAVDSSQLPNEEAPKLVRDQEPATGKSMEPKQHKEGGVKTQLKRRGRPRKLVIESSKVSVAGEEHNGAGGAADEKVVQDDTSKEIVLALSTGMESTGIRFIRGQKKLLHNPAKQENIVSNINQTPPATKEKLPNETDVRLLGKPVVARRSSKRRRKGSMSLNDELPTQGTQEASRENTAEVAGINCKAKDTEMATTPKISSNTADDDRPLSMWFGGMHSSTIPDDSRLSPGRIVKARERQDGSAIDAAGDDGNVLNKNEVLPFVKSSPIWKTIESLEVYQTTPQKPHFHPLKKCKEECREGLAIGSMVTFSNLVEKIPKLQFDDPRSVIDSSLETLLELEMHGFDAEAVRGRLNELLSIRDGQGPLLEKSKEAETQILEHTREKSRMEQEIDEIDKKLRELQEKRAMAVSTKESKDLEIAALKASMDVINESIQSARLDFERVAAAPW